jgi:hypothetical protein
VAWMVVLESRDPEGGEARREVFEVTPPPEPGRERAVLGQLVRGIHPGAVERSYDGAVAVFDDGAREIRASFTVDGAPGAPDPSRTPSQGTLFGPEPGGGG